MRSAIASTKSTGYETRLPAVPSPQPAATPRPRAARSRHRAGFRRRRGRCLRAPTCPRGGWNCPTPRWYRGRGRWRSRRWSAGITGFARIVLLAAILGAALSSAFSVANQLPNLVAALVLEATFTAIFVPVLARAEQSDPDGGAAFVRRLVTVTTTLLVFATAVSVVAAPLLVRLMLGRSPQVNEPLTTAFAYLLLPQVLAYGLTSVFMAILNTRNVFGPTAWAPVVNNVVALATLGVYLAVPGELSVDPVRMGNAKLLVLGIGTTLGVYAQTAILLIAAAPRAHQPAPAVGNRRAAQAVRRDGRRDGALRADQPARPGGGKPNRQYRSGFRPRDLQLHLAGADAAVRHDRRDGADRGDAAAEPQRGGQRHRGRARRPVAGHPADVDHADSDRGVHDRRRARDR